MQALIYTESNFSLQSSPYHTEAIYQGPSFVTRQHSYLLTKWSGG